MWVLEISGFAHRASGRAPVALPACALDPLTLCRARRGGGLTKRPRRRRTQRRGCRRGVPCGGKRARRGIPSKRSARRRGGEGEGGEGGALSSAIHSRLKAHTHPQQ